MQGSALRFNVQSLRFTKVSVSQSVGEIFPAASEVAIKHGFEAKAPRHARDCRNSTAGCTISPSNGDAQRAMPALHGHPRRPERRFRS